MGSLISLTFTLIPRRHDLRQASSSVATSVKLHPPSSLRIRLDSKPLASNTALSVTDRRRQSKPLASNTALSVLGLSGMATPRSLFRITTTVSKFFRPFSTITTTIAITATTDVASADDSATNHNRPPQEHIYLEPCSYIGSWKPPKNPKEAQNRLVFLRRDYANQVKALRKQYMQEVEELRLEKQRKEEARRKAIRIAKEERMKLKAETAKVRAEERKVAQVQFQEILLKERAEKLENWRMHEKRRKELEQQKLAELKQKSSVWIEESELESKVKEAIIDSFSL